mgnify:CR=1 FL=1
MHSYLWWPLLAWLLPLGGALGSRAHLWPWWPGFALCLASALTSLGLLLRLPWRYRSSPCLWADAWGIAPLLLPLLFVVQALRSPLTNDVSTDPHHPPRLLWAEQLRTAQDLPVNPPPLASFPQQPRSSLYPSLPGRGDRRSGRADDGARLAGAPEPGRPRCRGHHWLVRL